MVKQANRSRAKKRDATFPYTPPPPCALAYGSEGKWTKATTKSARQCVLDGLKRDLEWWRTDSCRGRPQPAKADLDATLCRLRSVSSRAVLTNMLLLRSAGGRMSAAIMLDPSDERGPMRHWPARPVAAIQQLAELQRRIDSRDLPPLPDFTAVLNPHDSPYQLDSNNWCGVSRREPPNYSHDALPPAYSTGRSPPRRVLTHGHV